MDKKWYEFDKKDAGQEGLALVKSVSERADALFDILDSFRERAKVYEEIIYYRSKKDKSEGREDEKPEYGHWPDKILT